jgi:hypothetical protein
MRVFSRPPPARREESGGPFILGQWMQENVSDLLPKSRAFACSVLRLCVVQADVEHAKRLGEALTEPVVKIITAFNPYHVTLRSKLPGGFKNSLVETPHGTEPLFVLAKLFNLIPLDLEQAKPTSSSRHSVHHSLLLQVHWLITVCVSHFTACTTQRRLESP